MSEVIRTVVVATVLATGTATRYDPGVMDPVVANRTIWGDIDPEVPHKGFVALLDCAHLGRLVWLEHAGRVDGPYMVADCAAERDQTRLRLLGFAVDLSWEVAQVWGVVHGPVSGFVVYDANPLDSLLPEGRVAT